MGLYLKYEQVRLNTFKFWLSTNADPILLAGDGFFYLNKSDFVECFYCKLELSEWGHRRDVFFEHRKYSPNCKFYLENIPIGKNPLTYNPNTDIFENEEDYIIKHFFSMKFGESIKSEDNLKILSGNSLTKQSTSYMCYEQIRLASFQFWKSKAVKPQTFAKYGLYYTNDSDRVKCFLCGIELIQWKSKDCPYLDHKRYSPRCFNEYDNIPINENPLTYRIYHDVSGCYRTNDVIKKIQKKQIIAKKKANRII